MVLLVFSTMRLAIAVSILAQPTHLPKHITIELEITFAYREILPV